MNVAHPHFAEPEWLWLAILGPIALLALQRYAGWLRRRDLARLAAVRAEIAKISDPFARRLLDPGNTPQEHTGPHLVTETCIFADASYDVTGTCVVNPHPEDSGDHYLIVKGTQEATFVISSRAERATEELLRLRARHYISLGFRIMVITLALIVAAAYAQTLP